MTYTLTADLHEKLRREALNFVGEKEKEAQSNRERLRDSVTQLREVGSPLASAPASRTTPSFKIGDVKEFPFSVEKGALPERGHLSEQGYKEFMSNLTDAASRKDLTSREMATSNAAQVVKRDIARGDHKSHGVKDNALHAVRQQVTFSAMELGQKLGLSPAASATIGYSLERALEKEGFKVLASHAIDRIGDVFNPSSASTAAATGLRAVMEKNLSSSLNWLATHGVTKDVMKDFVSQHTGKFLVLTSLANNPQDVMRVAQILSSSDKALTALSTIANDQELRKALGSIAVSTGESLAFAHKGLGSATIVAGSALRGDTTEETGRHIFRAAMSIIGGAAGGIATGSVSMGFGSVAGAVAGSAAGSALADKLLDVYDSHRNPNRQAQPSVSADELQASKNTVIRRINEKVGPASENLMQRTRSFSPG